METKVIVGLGSCGIAAGAKKVYDKIAALKEAEKLTFELKKTSCVGMCYREPLVEIIDESGSYLYGDITEDKAVELIDKHINQHNPIRDYMVYTDLFDSPEKEYVTSQNKITLRNCGYMDPESIEEYEARDGYRAIKKIAGSGMSRLDVIQTMLESGLRGRGGGGFPTGLKWKFANNNKSSEKYIICNADEGDPGAFMDSSVLEGDPHSVLEGMIIGAYAIEATAGVIYCRAEYPLAIKRLNIAIKQAREKGYLGNNILGMEGFNFDIYIKEGAGAFVCGEETALIASVEGERGMPRKSRHSLQLQGCGKNPPTSTMLKRLPIFPGSFSMAVRHTLNLERKKARGPKSLLWQGK